MTATTENRHADLLPLLEQQLYVAKTLEGLLMAEYSALLGSDVAALTDLVAQKRSTAEALERTSLALGHATGGDPLAAVMAAGGEPLHRWHALAALADVLRRQNLANGALLNERQNRLRWVAERASGGEPALYAPRPAPAFAALSGRSLARG